MSRTPSSVENLARRGRATAVLSTALAIVLGAGVPSYSETVSPELIEQARRQTEAQTLRASDGTPLCFLPVEVVTGTEAHVVDVYGATGSSAREGAETYGAVDVRVEATEAPALLILRSNEPVLWRLKISERSSLRAVHLVGYYEPLVSGLPDGVPLTWRYFEPVPRGQRQECIFVERDRPHSDDPDVLRLLEDPRHFGYYSAYGQMHDVIELRALRQHLELYASVPLVSYQRQGYGSRDVEQVTVGPEAARTFETTRQHGRELLATLSPPEIPVLGQDAPTLAVPENITGIDVVDWLVSQGYAQHTSDETVDYLCERDNAIALAEGLVLHWERCRFDSLRRGQHRSPGTRVISLLGPVQLSSASCGPAMITFLVPENISPDITTSCGWSVLTIIIGRE